jgi:glucose-1-phosphate thymidylyltransferase
MLGWPGVSGGDANKPNGMIGGEIVVGCNMYDERVFEIIGRGQKSARREYEITAVNNACVEGRELEYGFVRGRWTDAGTFESLVEAGQLLLELGNQI